MNANVVPAWSGQAITEIRRRDVLDVLDEISDRGAGSMASRVHAYFHRLFRWCLGRGIIERNPMEALPKPAPAVKRDLVLTDDEVAAVWKACDVIGWPFGEITRLLILTGARRNEIARLTWDEINGDVIRLSGDRTKSGEPHEIPLSIPACLIVAGLPHVGGGQYVFSRNGKTPAAGYAAAKKQLDDVVKIPAWRVHDLRRTVATGLQKIGVELTVTEAALGHVGGSRAGIVGIYQRHAYADEKRQALVLWAEHLMDLVK